MADLRQDISKQSLFILKVCHWMNCSINPNEKSNIDTNILFWLKALAEFWSFFWVDKRSAFNKLNDYSLWNILDAAVCLHFVVIFLQDEEGRRKYSSYVERFIQPGEEISEECREHLARKPVFLPRSIRSYNNSPYGKLREAPNENHIKTEENGVSKESSEM